MTSYLVQLSTPEGTSLTYSRSRRATREYLDLLGQVLGLLPINSLERPFTIYKGKMTIDFSFSN